MVGVPHRPLLPSPPTPFPLQVQKTLKLRCPAGLCSHVAAVYTNTLSRHIRTRIIYEHVAAAYTRTHTLPLPCRSRRRCCQGVLQNYASTLPSRSTQSRLYASMSGAFQSLGASSKRAPPKLVPHNILNGCFYKVNCPTKLSTYCYS